MRTRATWLLGLLLLAPAHSVGATIPPFDQEHAAFAEVLARVADRGRVNYSLLQRERGLLDRYRAQLGEASERALASWTREQQMAFWINAYNAGVLTTIIERYPISRGSLVGLAFPASSIWQIPGAFKARRHHVAGRDWSLDDIEHQILRPRFRDPRVHMALVCAARGCPPLRSEPFVGARLDRQLDDQARLYLADRVHGMNWSRGSAVVEVSSIFKWFAEDFAASGGVREFVARHSVEPEAAAAMRDPAYRLRYLDYDWTLNEP